MRALSHLAQVVEESGGAHTFVPRIPGVKGWWSYSAGSAAESLGIRGIPETCQQWRHQAQAKKLPKLEPFFQKAQEPESFCLSILISPMPLAYCGSCIRHRALRRYTLQAAPGIPNSAGPGCPARKMTVNPNPHPLMPHLGSFLVSLAKLCGSDLPI